MNISKQVTENSITQYAQKHSLKGKKVLLRIDVNTSLGENGTVDPGEDWRIVQSYQTIKFLVNEGACVLLLSHIGRDPNASLKPIFEYMSQEIQLGFLPDYDYDLITERIDSMQHGSVLMLENVRQHEGEKINDASFLKPITECCDIYVNDAFSVSHREHASVHGVTKLLPSFFGIQFTKEIEYLSPTRLIIRKIISKFN